MFEGEGNDIYTGHYFMKDRGRKAIDACKAMLSEIFDAYGAKVIRGFTPSENKAALWMNRQLGFKSYGPIETFAGPCEQVILTRKDYE